MIKEGFREFARLVAAEGAVLLKNDGGILPVRNEKIAVFGRCQTDYYRAGLGSGGAVNTPYTSNLLDGFLNNEFLDADERLAGLYKSFPPSKPRYDGLEDEEPYICDEEIENASKRCDKAIVILGRHVGESNDTRYEPYSYFLGETELNLLKRVRKFFAKTIVLLNMGNLTDLNFIDELDIPAVLCLWLGGEEGGNAALDLISGKINPSGRLSDTIAYKYEDWPSADAFSHDEKVIYKEDIFVGYRYFETFAKDRVRYPFGYGLSYGKCETSCTGALLRDNEVKLDFLVKNIGNCGLKQVVQVYVKAPCGKMSRPERELKAFVKTNLIKPGCSEKVKTSFQISDLSAYDEENACYVLEAGLYEVYAGDNVRDAEKVFEFNLNDDIITEKCKNALCPIEPFEKMVNKNGKAEFEPAITGNYKLSERISEELPKDNIKAFSGDFKEAVKENKIKEFAASLTEDELLTLSRGEGTLPPRVTPGVVSCFGALSESLSKRGIPVAATSDGPSGIRLENGSPATCMPCGVLIACTWDTDLIEKMYEFEGAELCLNKVDMLLGPGMNIHRTPLCGRNFEYFSEDPLLSGMMAAAEIRGLCRGKSAGVLKHFAANNREYLRGRANAVVSERALREIYLKGFEIAVKTSPVIGIMTSYNPVNGYHSASNYDLNTTLLRNEWGYDGFVMTDWWSTMNYEPYEEPDGKKIGSMIRAQNDIYMVVTNYEAENWQDDGKESLENGRITKGQLIRNAANILKNMARLYCFERKFGFRLEPPQYGEWFKTSTDERNYPLIKCKIPENIEKKKEFKFMDMLEINKIHRYDDIKIAPGESVMLSFKNDHEMKKARLCLYVKTDTDNLAQYSIFAMTRDYVYDRHIEYPIAFNGTGGEISEIVKEMEFGEDWSYVEMTFSKANFSDVMLCGAYAEYI